MGRVGSAWRGIVWGAFPIGSLIGGALASFGGLQLPLLIAGVAQCAVAVGLAGPLTRRLGDAERSLTPAGDTGGGPGELHATTSEAGDETTQAAADSDAPRTGSNRRLHSRSGQRLYQGRSSKTRWR